ncbi:LapA family protein [Sphingobacterium thalpophilum]|uniref:LapA family protein n=1 Tax=Sphingobacterium thalpophilum TaxID=259 RepID=UPI003C715DB0
MRKILLIALSVVITLICAQNTQEVSVGLIVKTQIALWKLLLLFFILGMLFAFLLKGGKRKTQAPLVGNTDYSADDYPEHNTGLSDEDREFLS